DALEGRGLGTKGINEAADYIAKEFSALGLKTDAFDGKPFQEFKVTTGSKLGKDNRLEAVQAPKKDGDKPSKRVLKLGTDYNPMSFSGSGKLDVPVVFVGYGISAKDKKFDEYKGLDVKGKAVMILRKIPQQGNPHSMFGGDATRSDHAPFVKKVSNAYQHGAAAVIFVTDSHEIAKSQERLNKSVLQAVDRLAQLDEQFKKKKTPSDKDREEHQEQREKMVSQIIKQGQQLRKIRNQPMSFSRGPRGGPGRSIPITHWSRAAADEVLKNSIGKDVAQLEAEIDKGPTTHSQELKGLRLVGEVSVDRTQTDVKNIVAVLEGEGPIAEETIVIGAHYDHLGMGGMGSRFPQKKAVHNGADDNGSGTVALLEVARALTSREKKLPRRVVFIAFTAEERGLIGSAEYVRKPLIPLNKTVAMLNMDMVGRLRDDKLTIFGTGTAPEFKPLLDRLNKKHGFKITEKPAGFGPSDHSSFYAKKIPVLHFFTGTHKEYHTPDDDFKTVNVQGISRVAQLVLESAVALAEAKAPPKYVEVKSKQTTRPMGDRPYFGSIPDFAQSKPGYALQGVSKGSPAEKGGLKTGDVIVQLGEAKIGNLEDFDGALRKYNAGDKVP
ncbi:MAG: M20/M25/M40 family metallo-hydrolase, partial [Planctomycetales bacterium]